MTGAAPRLNVWQRLAIVITVIGIIGGTMTLHVLTMKQQRDFAIGMERVCTHMVDRLQEDSPDKDFSARREKCASEMGHNATLTPASTVFWGSFFIASGMALVAWVLFGIVFATVRWVLAGRARG
jgi:hypothetical protein